MSRTVLVTYASKMGATAEIAAAIGEELRAHGHEVDVRDVSDVDTIERYDAVVLGSAIYIRRWRRTAVHFLRQHLHELRQRQVWLFHSGPVGPDQDAEQPMPGNVRRLAHAIGATPAVTFAGRLEQSTATGFLARRMARGAFAGDCRDWPKIRAWAGDVSAAIGATQRSHWHRPPATRATKHALRPPAGHFLG
ncbi:flavodoxin domain-containing protein [Kribbella sp. NPDC058245]|uniref:flavodoxin domain-containing protein n=1 Tax=Kribbella sp. NPDC058245 TaxID=3346399 RepID=UPI0036F0F318